MSALEEAKEIYEKRLGEKSQPGDWFEMEQDRVNQFAEVTGDHQWIHVDVDRANKESPFGGPIAHGQLTLSILGLVGRTSAAPQAAPAPQGPRPKLTVNYGFDKVRFPSPVPVGAKIRSVRELKRVEEKNGSLELMSEIKVEVEGQEKPACVAESLSRLYF